MSKNIFKHISIKDIGKPLKVKTSHFDTKPKTTSKEEEVYKEREETNTIQATIEDLEKEFAQKVQGLDREYRTKKEELEREVELIKKEAENWAFAKIQEATEDYENKIEEAEKVYSTKVEGAEIKASEIIGQAQKEADKLEGEAYTKGFSEGSEEGYKKGSEEAERLISRLNVMLTSSTKKRNQILEETESQIIDIVITIARKVVKSVSESHKRVVYDNITEALSKIKGRAEITIRVNMEDLQMTTKHKKEFIQMLEGIEQVRILEDNSVEKGGCYISTDFGTIDARISTQLSAIEEQIKKLSPQKESL